MKIFIAGGTGLIGYHSALEFLSKGDDVCAVSIPDIMLGDWFPREIELKYADVFAMEEDELVPLIEGCEGFLYALGPDDRVTPLSPAYKYFHERLVIHCEKALRAAKRAGVKKCVVLNSYFAYFDRIWPGLNLSERHPYIKCRVEQAEAALKLGSGGMEVCVLELPYIFGTMPQRVPLWKDVLINMLKRMKVVFFPKGGTSMIAIKHVAEAVYGAMHYGKNGERYTIGDINMEWKDMLKIMLDAMGENKKIIYLPKFMLNAQGRKMKKMHELEGRESGLNPLHLFSDIQCRFLYLDPEKSRSILGYGSGGIEEAIAETVKMCL